MAGNNRQKKSSTSFSVLNIFKAKKCRKVEDVWDDSIKSYKVWPSDGDKGRCVAEPDIDWKATVYITKIRARHISEAEPQTAAVSN